MKNKLAVASLSLLLIPAIGQADECKDVGSYTVEAVSFKDASVDQALTAILHGTPLRAGVTNPGASTPLVSASGVSGPLDVVLGQLSESTGFTWMQDGCSIPVVITNGKGAFSWSVQKDETLQSVLKRWSSAMGWTVSWEVGHDEMLGADAAFAGKYEAAVEKLMQAVKSSGTKVNFKFYYGNRMLRVYKDSEMKVSSEQSQ